MKRHRKKLFIGVPALLVIGLMIFGTARGNRTETEVPEATQRGIPVRTEQPRAMTFTRGLSLQGSLESEHFALVPAETQGTVERLLVEEGEAVEPGQPLCELDSEILERALESQLQELAVASNALAVSLAQEDQARADHDLQQKNLDRFQRLVQDEAISVSRLDEAERNAKMAQAAHHVALAQADLSRARVKQAETAVAIARRNLEDATIRAPIAGRISMKYRERGEMVHPGDPVFRIDDPSALEASVFLPAGAYGDVTPGRTVARISMGNRDLGEYPVSYRSPTVDERLRTFEVKARIPDPPDGVVAGGLADVQVVFEEREGLGIPADALSTRNGKDIAFLNEAGVSRPAELRTGLRTEGYLEIVEGIDDDASVIVQGQQFVNDGDALSVVED